MNVLKNLDSHDGWSVEKYGNCIRIGRGSHTTLVKLPLVKALALLVSLLNKPRKTR